MSGLHYTLMFLLRMSVMLVVIILVMFRRNVKDSVTIFEVFSLTNLFPISHPLA